MNLWNQKWDFKHNYYRPKYKRVRWKLLMPAKIFVSDENDQFDFEVKLNIISEKKYKAPCDRTYYSTKCFYGIDPTKFKYPWVGKIDWKSRKMTYFLDTSAILSNLENNSEPTYIQLILLLIILPLCFIHKNNHKFHRLDKTENDFWFIHAIWLHCTCN